jgi:signal transduction histidine kinase
LRYSGIDLSAPEAVRYSYKLEGVDKQWISAGRRRTIAYTNLRFGQYRFVVKGQLKDGPASETSYDFKISPHFYETSMFRGLGALMLILAGAFAYKLHLRRIRSRFALVLQERARLAREIHDTLAQGFVGISSQLDAVSICLSENPQAAQDNLDLARKMTRHSLSEARRSVADLRASALLGHDLATALKAEAVRWTATSNLKLQVDICPQPERLPQEIEQNLLRIAQEAVTNTLKHASAAKLLVQLRVEAQNLCLLVADDGRGCAKPDMSSSLEGHFGLIGMRERAQSIGGHFRFQSEPGNGTFVEVMVPLT